MDIFIVCGRLGILGAFTTMDAAQMACRRYRDTWPDEGTALYACAVDSEIGSGLANRLMEVHSGGRRGNIDSGTIHVYGTPHQ